MMYSRIAGTGSYLPPRILTNRELESMVDTTDEWILARTGIQQRHIADDDQGTCDLAEHAARRALELANIDANELDLIIVATTTPDRVFPSTACLLQERLGASGYAAFDVQAVCSGFIYALGVADKFIRSGEARHALVVGSETMSRIVDWSDRSTCILFGDGAGAVVLAADDTPGIISTRLHADGRNKDLLTVPAGVSTRHNGAAESAAYIRMRGNEVFKVAVNTLGQLVVDTLAQSQLNKGDIDWLVPHQANERIVAATARKLDLPMDRVVITVDRHANTSAASVPLALDEAVRDGRIKRGDMLLLEAFGGGFTWGAALVQY